jgi:hypothetical protein
MDIADIYRIFHKIHAEYTFFSTTHGIVSKRGHILGHNASFNKYKKIKKIFVSHQNIME